MKGQSAAWYKQEWIFIMGRLVIGFLAMAGKVLWIRVCPSFRPSIWRFSWKFSSRPLLLGAIWCCAWQSGIFWKKQFLFQKWGKLVKSGFLKFFGKFSHYFFLNLVSNESLYHLLYSCTNPIFGKIYFLRYMPKCCWPIKLQDWILNQLYL